MKSISLAQALEILSKSFLNVYDNGEEYVTNISIDNKITGKENHIVIVIGRTLIKETDNLSVLADGNNLVFKDTLGNDIEIMPLVLQDVENLECII